MYITYTVKSDSDFAYKKSRKPITSELQSKVY